MGLIACKECVYCRDTFNEGQEECLAVEDRAAYAGVFDFYNGAWKRPQLKQYRLCRDINTGGHCPWYKEKTND
jgi:hypothetical protein